MTADTTQQEREAFEAALTTLCEPGTPSFIKDKSGDYVYWESEWNIWQAARATPQGAEPVANAWIMDGELEDLEGIPHAKLPPDGMYSLYTHPPEPKLSELQADAWRLDWLQAKTTGPLPLVRVLIMNNGVYTEAKGDLRAAIDTQLARQEGSAT